MCTESNRAIAEAFRAGGYLKQFNISPEQLAQFETYAALLAETNAVMNLTAITDPAGIVIRHFVDSLTLLSDLDRLCLRPAASLPLRLADVGTGAGFPGLPLKIMRPEIRLYLIDALAKRVSFLERVTSALALDGVEAHHLRAEAAGRAPALRDQMDVVCARAVAPLPVLAEYCLPLVRPLGFFLAMKGEADAEVRAAKSAVAQLGGRIAAVRTFRLPGTDMHRTVIAVEKIKPTPRAFPRADGKPRRHPL